jgi:hypothetical protein
MTVTDRYGWSDRLLYRLAFRLGITQQALADVEQVLYGDALNADPNPVFVTALPRSGTTILLQLLCETGHFASHTYADMPFVLCPMLWQRFNAPFAVDDEAKQRAHDDGLTVSTESPEAFEEMVWKHFWSAPYGDDRIRPWRDDDEHREFDAFFRTHMQKVIALRQTDASGPLRYLSKNNLNIARLAAPPDPLRDGTFVVPFRDPLQQAASMHGQHERFLDLHDEDDFVREIMEAIGHHEFGKGLRPVNFDGWLDDAPPPDRLAFWVQYWIAAYRFVLAHAGPSCVLVPYDRLTHEPERILSGLADALDVPAADLVAHAERLSPPDAHPVDDASLSASTRDAAATVFERLQERAASQPCFT